MQDRQSDFTASFKVRKTRQRALFVAVRWVRLLRFRTKHTCKLVQDGIEIITGGRLVLFKGNDQYYNIAVYSGNLNFFTTIAKLKITNLTLFDITWSASVAAASHGTDGNYVFPLCEPSNDGLTPLPDTGTEVELYAGWVWPFIKVKAIWDEIFANAGYTVEGDIFTDPMFTSLFMPISTLQVNYADTAALLYNVHVQNRRVMTASLNRLDWTISSTVTSYVGDNLWRNFAIYDVQYAADYTFRVTIVNPYGVPTNVYYMLGRYWWASWWMMVIIAVLLYAGMRGTYSLLTGWNMVFLYHV